MKSRRQAATQDETLPGVDDYITACQEALDDLRTEFERRVDALCDRIDQRTGANTEPLTR